MVALLDVDTDDAICDNERCQAGSEARWRGGMIPGMIGRVAV